MVASKWGYRYVADWDRDARVHDVKDHTLAMLDTQFEESRSRLGDHLAAYQVHSVTAKSGVLADDAVLDRLTAISRPEASPCSTAGRMLTPAEVNVPVALHQTLVTPGDYIFGNTDGVVVLPETMAEEVLETVSIGMPTSSDSDPESRTGIEQLG